MRYPRFFSLLLLVFGYAAADAGNIRLEYAPVFYRYETGTRFSGGLAGQLQFGASFYGGLTYSFQLSRKSSLALGLGLLRNRFGKQYQGIFPETNAYGLAVVSQRNDYWVFPVSYFQSFSSRTNYTAGVRISYLPCVLGAARRDIVLAGGAAQSGFEERFTDDSQVFEHSLRLYTSNQVATGKGGMIIGIDPYIGFGSGFFKSDGMKINTISLGLSLGLQFKAPRISIDIERKPDPDELRKKKELEQKQKEIEQQLKNKPKKARQ